MALKALRIYLKKVLPSNKSMSCQEKKYEYFFHQIINGTFIFKDFVLLL